MWHIHFYSHTFCIYTFMNTYIFIHRYVYILTYCGLIHTHTHTYNIRMNFFFCIMMFWHLQKKPSVWGRTALPRTSQCLGIARGLASSAPLIRKRTTPEPHLSLAQRQYSPAAITQVLEQASRGRQPLEPEASGNPPNGPLLAVCLALLVLAHPSRGSGVDAPSLLRLLPSQNVVGLQWPGVVSHGSYF